MCGYICSKSRIYDQVQKRPDNVESFSQYLIRVLLGIYGEKNSYVRMHVGITILNNQVVDFILWVIVIKYRT